jgi:hypothetical protein
MICKIFEVKNVFSIIVLIIICLFVNSVTAQDVNISNDEKAKANEILAIARKATGLGKEKGNIGKISLIYNVSKFDKTFIKDSKREDESQQIGEREFNSELPNKFWFLESLKLEDTLWISKFILDGDLLDADKYGMWEGQRTEIQIKGRENPTEEQKRQEIREKKEEAFFILFPILLDSSGFFPLEFRYIGKAEFNSEKADVVEAILNEESKIRLFFDETTRLLKILMTESKLQNGTQIEEKRFYSDYKTVDGLKIAKKINVELKQTHTRFVSEGIEEQTLKTIKINPTFKPDFFEVKKK